MLSLICLRFPYAGFSRPTFYHLKNRKSSLGREHYFFHSLLSGYLSTIFHQNHVECIEHSSWHSRSIHPRPIHSHFVTGCRDHTRRIVGEGIEDHIKE